MERTPRAILLVLLLGVTAIPIADSGTITDESTTRQYREDFESYLSGNVPADSWYTVTTTGSGTHQVSSPAPTGGDKDWKLSDTATGYAAQLRNTGAGVDLCQGGQSLAWQFQVAAPINLGTAWEMRTTTGVVVGTPQPSNSVGVSVSGAAGAETITSYVRGGGAATTSSHPLSYTAGTLVNVQVSQVNCGGAAASAVFTYSGAFTLTETVTTTTTLTGDLDRFTAASTGTVVSSTDLFLDAVTWDGAPIPAPTISTINPNQGLVRGGNTVTLTGTGFRNETTVAFDGQDAPVTSSSATQLVVTVPPHAAGLVDVVVTNPDGQTATKVDGYRYNAPPAPIITARSPSAGPVSGGNMVNITGNNFDPAATVNFDGTASPHVVFVSSSNLRAQAPPHPKGDVVFQVCNPDAQCDSATFEYVADPEAPAEEPEAGELAFGPARGVGQGNMDNNYGAYTSGDLVILVHTVDAPSNIIVVETSTDAGATFTTRSTGLAFPFGVNTFTGDVFAADYINPQISVVAESASRIALVACSSNQVVRTIDGVNYQTVAMPSATGWAQAIVDTVGCDAELVGSTLVVARWQCARSHSAGDFNNCRGGHFASPPNDKYAQVVISTSPDLGATWTSTTAPFSLTYGGHGSSSPLAQLKGLALSAPNPTTWNVFFSYATASSIVSTTSGGSLWNGPTPYNDQFVPIANFGAGVAASNDANAVSFLDNSNGNHVVGIRIPGDLWSFVPTGAASINYAADAYHCGGYAVTFRQGATNQDRVTVTKTVPATPTTTPSTATTPVTGTTAASAAPFVTYQLGDDFTVVYASTAGQMLLKTTTGSACPPPPADSSVSVSASVDVPRLIGFDVDHTGSNVIARQQQEDFEHHNILTFSGTNLSPSGSADVAGEDCGLDGVTALLNVVGWWDCQDQFHGTTNFPGTIEIRAPDLSDPNWFPSCADFCHRHMEMPNANTYDVGDVYLVPFDYTISDDSPAVALAAAYTTLNGKVGATVFVQRDAAGDRNAYQERLFDASTNPVSQFCTAHNKHTGKDYLAAASPGATTKVYEVRINPDLQPAKFGVSNPKPTVFLSESPLVLPQALAGGDGVACGQQWVAVTNADGIRVYDTINRTIAWSINRGSTTRGVTVSGNGECLAYWRNGTIHVAHANNGTIVTSISYPLGDELLNKMALDSLCQVLFVAIQGSNGRIDKFVISQAMGTEDLAYDEGQGITDENDPSNPNFGKNGGDGEETSPGSAGETWFSSMGPLFGFALMGIFIVGARRWWDLEPETIKIGVLVIWIALVFWFKVWDPVTLIAAGVVGALMFSNKIAKSLGG